MIKSLIQEGFLLKNKGFYKHAIEVFYKALELDNSSLELLLEIADVYFLYGETERAINYLEQILEKKPTHISALKLLKKIFESNESWENAIQTALSIYQCSLKTDDFIDVLMLLNRASGYQDVLNYKISDTDFRIFYERAFANFMLKDYSSALEEINNALSLNKSDKMSLLLKGKILFKLNRKSECAIFLENLDEDSKNPDECCFVGLIYQNQGEYNKALYCFKNAIKLVPDYDEYYYNCASTYFKMGDIQSAKKYYNLAISLNPNNQRYHFALANMYYSEKQYKRALSELDYDFFEAKLLKAIILYDSGYFAIAKKEFDLLYQEQSDNHLLNEYMSKIKKELGIN